MMNLSREIAIEICSYVYCKNNIKLDSKQLFYKRK